MLRIGVIMYQTSLTKGQELVAQRMVKEFRRQGHEAFLITSIFHDGDPAGLGADEVKKRGGYVHVFDRLLEIPVIRLSSDGATWPPRRIAFEDFMGILTKIVEELDLNVLITHSTLWNGPEEVVKFVRWRRKMTVGGAPYHHVVFCHMSHFQEPSDERYAIQERSYRETWNSTVLSQIVQTADVILLTTPYEGAYMRNLGASDDKLMSFPAGIEDEVIMSMGDADGFKAQHKLNGGKKIVSYLGSVEERKNPLAILEVAKILSKRSDIHFIVAGKLEGDYGTVVKAEASKLGNVSVLGVISEQDKFSLIRASFVNISMSRSESLGISQLEFMSMGVPVITSGVGGQSWIVRDGFNGAVLKGPADVEGAANAITRLAGSPSEMKKLGRNAAHFTSGFSITRLIVALSRRLESELRKHPDGMLSFQRTPGEERVMEAWAHGGQNVAATSSRLIIRTAAKRGKDAIIIPYNEIAKIVRHVKAPWPILSLGITTTALLLLQEMVLGLGFRDLGPGISAFLSVFGLAALTSSLVVFLLILPLFVSLVAFGLMLKEGYVIHYGPAKRRIFLPKSFVKALKLAARLTPNDMFVVDDEDS